MNSLPRAELLRLGLALAGGLLLGELSGQTAVALALTALGLLGWHGYYLTRLLEWLKKPSRPQPPLPAGVYRAIAERVQGLHARNRKRKRRLSTFIGRFREAAAAIPDALIILNKQTQVQWCNPAADALLGMHWPMVAGIPFSRLVRQEEVAEYLDARDYSRPLEFSPLANKNKVLSLLIVPFGRKRQQLVVVRDITRIYLLDRTRQDFVANVSHELRTPLTVISGFLETLLDEEDLQADWGASLQLMQSQAERMQHIVHDLLTLSGLEMQGLPEQPVPVDVPGILQDIVIEARLLGRETRHEVALRAEPVWLRGEAKDLRSAFANLVYNAVRHTPPGSNVRVNWRLTPQGAYLDVSDNGDGIPAQHLPRLTERFYRVDKGRSRATGGTGLGLAIVKHALHRYGASLHISSESGRGSRFSCHFPLALVLPEQEDGSL